MRRIGGDDMLAENLAANVRKLRIERGWSQEDLARYTNGEVKTGTVNRIERGGNTTTNTIEALAKALGVAGADLTSNSEIPVTHDNIR